MNDVINELIELQTRLAFQEDTINQLNNVVTQQDATILQLQQQMRLLAKRMDELATGQTEGGEVLNERPPHY